jgi:hypothetical protein
VGAFMDLWKDDIFSLSLKRSVPVQCSRGDTPRARDTIADRLDQCTLLQCTLVEGIRQNW